VRLKVAASIDGRTALASGESQWITGAAARADGHAWRARACAILTGVGTVLYDNPQMTVRDVATSRQPRRVIVDRHGQTPASARILDGAGALIVTNGERNNAWPPQVETLALPDPHGRVDLVAMMQAFGARGINELHVEAGARLNGALLEAGLVDELLLYVAPRVIGDPARGAFARPLALASLAASESFTWHDVQQVGSDLRIRMQRVVAEVA
jgi:diaminohydroxyphosphoribosylaminopyrimidine deaminase/5-amino-6-(5-phosphoribosylamino)uracil reductase